MAAWISLTGDGKTTPASAETNPRALVGRPRSIPKTFPGLLSKWEESRDCVADMCEARLRAVRQRIPVKVSRFCRERLYATKVVRSLDGLEQELILNPSDSARRCIAAEQQTLGVDR